MLVPVFFAACTGASDLGGEPGGTVVSSSGLRVTATISAAVLGDEGCSGSSAKATAGSCYSPPAAARDGGAPASSDSTGTGCGGGCRPSSMQIVFEASSGTGSAHVSVTKVRLLDDASGGELAALTASTPTAWDAGVGHYQPWDENVASSARAQTSYLLSAPAWSTIGSSYSHRYRLEVTVVIDGKATVVDSPSLQREPAVST